MARSGRTVGLLKFGGVDIDLDLEGIARERLPVVTGLPDVEARSEDQQKVGILHREVPGAVADGALASAKERVVGGDEVVGPGRGDGNAQPVNQVRRIPRRHGRRERRCRRESPDASRLRCARELRGTGTASVTQSRQRVCCELVLGRIVAAKTAGIDGRSLHVDGNIEPAGPGRQLCARCQARSR